MFISKQCELRRLEPRSRVTSLVYVSLVKIKSNVTNCNHDIKALNNGIDNVSDACDAPVVCYAAL